MLASCLYTGGIPPIVPPGMHAHDSHDNDDEASTGNYMKVAGARHKPRKGKRKRYYKSIVDSGATIHCIRDRRLFTTLDTSTSTPVRVADNRVIHGEGIGSCNVLLRSADGSMHTIVLHNCIYSPHFSDNLISTRRLWLDNKMSTHLGATSYFKCAYTHTRYYFNNDLSYKMIPEAHKVDVSDPSVIHARFNHCGKHRLNKMFDVTKGLGDKPHTAHNHDPHTCPACLEGGARRKAFAKRKKHEYTYFGERISSDLCGPFPKSVDGFTYALIFVDAYTDYSALYLLKSKLADEVRSSFKEFLNDHAHLIDSGNQVRWHTDNGGEFMSHDINEFCDEFAIKRSFSVPYAPPQNAHAERMWGILLRPVRTLLAGAKIDSAFWSYAMRHANQCRNVMPSYSQPNMRTPWEALTGTKPDVSKFRVWGCLTWYLVPDHELDSKISPRAWPAIHLGFDPLRNGYIVYIPQKNRITTGFHVTFQEHRFLKVTPTHVIGLPNIPKPIRKPTMLYKEPRDSRAPPPALQSPHPGIHVHDRGRYDEDDDRANDDTHDDESANENANDERPTRVGTYGAVPHRATRNPNPAYVNVIIDDVTHKAYMIQVDKSMSPIPVPQSYNEAIASNLKDRWIASMELEIGALMKHDTWELVSIDDVPHNRKIVKSRFVYTIKYNRDGTVERFKSRFVACGYSQVKGFDYESTFSATLRSTSFRMLCAIAAGKKLTLEHFDVTNAFTQSEIDAEIYVQAPPGQFTPKDNQGRPKVLLLKKALYGTKQASKLWQDTLVRHLMKMGYTQLKNDPCVFIKHKSSHVMRVGVYVDDVIVAHDSPALLEEFKREFTGAGGFNATYKGKLDWFLGMAIDQHADHTISVHQSKYIEKLLDKFVPSHSTSTRMHSMPCNPESFQRLTKSRSPDEKERVSKLPYMELIGSLLYLSTMTRPDIAYHMSVLCSFMHDPSIDCFNAAVDLLLFIGSTKHYHLRYDGCVHVPHRVDHAKHRIPKAHGIVAGKELVENNCGFSAYSDASWHKGDELGYNMFGYVVYLYGGPVAFSAKRLKVVALSSAEAEYAAASYSCKEITFVRAMCNELDLEVKGAVALHVDNEAAIKIAENRGVSGRNKHFIDAIHYIRHMIDHLYVKVFYVPTADQLADGFTKPLDKSKFRSWSSRLMNGVGDEYMR